jgi:hypothetical protein
MGAGINVEKRLLAEHTQTRRALRLGGAGIVFAGPVLMPNTDANRHGLPGQ